MTAWDSMKLSLAAFHAALIEQSPSFAAVLQWQHLYWLHIRLVLKCRQIYSNVRISYSVVLHSQLHSGRIHAEGADKYVGGDRLHLSRLSGLVSNGLVNSYEDGRVPNKNKESAVSQILSLKWSRSHCFSYSFFFASFTHSHWQTHAAFFNQTCIQIFSPQLKRSLWFLMGKLKAVLVKKMDF